MPEEIVKFCEFWNELKNIYKETYPDAYKKYDFPDGETFLAIDYLKKERESSIKRAVEAGCVAPDTYENIKNILRSGKLDDKIAAEDKQQILEDKWGEQFASIRLEWSFNYISQVTNDESVIEEAEKFIKKVNEVKKEQNRLEMEKRKAEEAARKLAEQQKAAVEADRKRQAEFEKMFQKEDEEAKTESSERYEEQKNLRYLREDVEHGRKWMNSYREYEAKIAEKEAKREKRKAERLEAEKNWTEEYREEVKRRREIYRQNREKKELLEKEQIKRAQEEEKKKKKYEIERRIAESETLKNDLKNWLSDGSTSLSEKKEGMKQAREQYQQNPEGTLEWAKTLARFSVELNGLQNHTRFDFGDKKQMDQLEDACSNMQTQEATDEFRALIDQGKKYCNEIGSARYQVYNEKKNLPKYIQEFINQEAEDIEEDLFDKYERGQEYQEKRQKAREERLKTVTERYQKELEEKRKQEAEEAEKQAREQEEAEKQRKEQEEAEKQRQEQEKQAREQEKQQEPENQKQELKQQEPENQKQELKQQEPEKQQELEPEEQEKQRQELEAAERKRFEQEIAVRKDIFAAYDAVKDTKNRNFLKNHNKFAEMKAALQAYKETFPEGKAKEEISDYEKKSITDRAYATCLAYLKSHLATNQAGSSMKGQETPEGRLRKQAVVQIMENMKQLPEFKDKQELLDNDRLHEEAGEKNPQPNENQRERINFSQLKNSLAAKSKVNHQKAYAELEEKKAQRNQMGPKK